ncbi:hypothetical protein EV421DRAFT_1739129 [Armillaria borealis]|uniref:Uncharacterized protein n=1 Tax=Armillaria borealis TaxID=47425 RepID=A0AA39MKN7_9AGAR|nr:hypothetical protein EV421DRAFT_1739129 [Armillaria borealis]
MMQSVLGTQLTKTSLQLSRSCAHLSPQGFDQGVIDSDDEACGDAAWVSETGCPIVCGHGRGVGGSLSIQTRNDKGLGGHFERVVERALVPEEQHYKRIIPWEGVTLELYTIGTFDSYLQQRFKGESKWEGIEHTDTWEPFECGEGGLNVMTR